MVADEGTAEGLRGALGEVSGLISAYLFGSVAEGRAHRASDLDLGVLLDWTTYPSPAARFDARLRLTARLRGAAGRDVDLVVLNDAPPQLARHVMTTGRPIVVRDALRNHAHLRTVLSRAADLEPFLRRMRAIKLSALAR